MPEDSPQVMKEEIDQCKQVLRSSQGMGLYSKLILQLQRDLSRAGRNVQIPSDIDPGSLVTLLLNELYALAEQGPSALQQLFYIADVSETKLVKANGLPTEDKFLFYTYLFVERCWRKVHSRHTFG